MAKDTDIEEWLLAEGIVDAGSRMDARVVLAAAGLTRAGKQRMADDKLEKARDVLWARVTPVCSDTACIAGAARAQFPVVTTTRERCIVCGGSNTRRAVTAMVEACAKAGLERVLVIGGSGAAHAELRQAVAESAIELRIIDGLNAKPTKRTAAPDLAWAQLMVVWASTQLPHRVSQAFTEGRPRELPLITVAKRGVESFCLEVARFARGR